MNIPNNKLLIIAQVYFLGLFLVLMVYSFLILILGLFRFKEVQYDDILLVILIHAYLFAISFTNISTPRYLMAIYPFLLISCIKFYCLTKKFTDKRNKSLS